MLNFGKSCTYVQGAHVACMFSDFNTCQKDTDYTSDAPWNSRL